MSREKYTIDKNITLSKLDWLIEIEKDKEIVPKLFFIRLRYLGNSVEKATKELGFAKSIGYEWQKKWNENGYDGLHHKLGAGRHSKLRDEQIQELKSILDEDFWTIEEVRELIKNKYGIEYSLNAIRKILKKFGLNYTKPYCLDSRKPPDAEEILRKT